MELTDIKKLLIKYENAKTTLEEEAILRRHFLSEKVSSQLKEYQDIFTYHRASKKEEITINNDFKIKTRNYSWISVAASIIFLLSVYLGNTKYREYQEEKEALNTLTEVARGLKLISANLNKGNQSFKKLYVFDNTLNKILKP